MCDPIIGAALVIGQGVMKYQQAEANEAATKARNSQIRSNADAAFANAQRTADIKQRQLTEVSAQEKFEARIEAMENSATKQVRSGEAGITGLSVDALLADTQMQAGTNQQKLKRNFTNEIASLNEERRAAAIARQQRYNTQQAAQGGNIFGTMLEIGAGLYGIDGLGDSLSIGGGGSGGLFGNSFGMGRSAMTTSSVTSNASSISQLGASGGFGGSTSANFNVNPMFQGQSIAFG